MSKRILPLCIVLVLGSCLCSRAHAAGKRWGIAIGVQYYMIRDVPLLNYSNKDAETVYDTLIGKGGYPREQVKVLHSGLNTQGLSLGDKDTPSTTRANLMSEIEDLLKQPGPEDVVFIYFSGHGFVHEKDSVKECVLATYDYNPADPFGTGIRSSWLHEQLKGCQAKRKVLILDCCHAGQGTKGTASGKVLQAPLKRLHDESEGLVVIGSCADDQQSYEWDDKKMSVFTFFLIEGLKGDADKDQDGIVDHRELFNYVEANVRDQSARLTNGGKQLPILYHNKVQGSFALVVGPAKPMGPALPPVPNPNKPPEPSIVQPSANAENAYARLKAGQVAVEDLETLVSEAVKLRKPAVGQIKKLRTGNPYFIEEQSEHVYGWLILARPHAGNLNDASQASLKASLALSAWFKHDRDAQTAAELIKELGYPFNNLSVAESDVRLQLMLIHAGTLSDAPRALQSYVDVLDLLENEEQLAQKDDEVVPLMDVWAEVVSPAFTVVNQMQAKGGLQGSPFATLAARVLGKRGQIVEKDVTLFQEDQIAAVQSDLRLAIDLNKLAPQWPLAMASLLLQAPKPDLAKLQEARVHAENALRLSGTDQFSRLSAARMVADAWQRESRLSTIMTERLQKLGSAVSHYGLAIQTGYNGFEMKPGIQRRAMRHYVDALLGRSAARLHEANLKLATPQQRAELLKQAVADAQSAAKLDDERVVYYANLALGNAWEDCASQCGDLDAFPKAVKAFKTAQSDQPFNAEPFMNLARCQFKWAGTSKNETDKDGRLQESARLLKFVVDELYEDKALAEAHFWLGKVYTAKKDFLTADHHYQLAWSGGEKSGIGGRPKGSEKEKWQGMEHAEFDTHNRAIYIEERASSLLQRGEELVANTGIGAKDEREKEAFKTLGDADYWAQMLKQYSRLKSAVIKARALELQWRLRPNVPPVKQGEIHPKLVDADAVLVEAMKAPLTNSERAILLRCRAELLWDTDWRILDIAQATPTAIANADEAASLASDPDERAQAFGIAGVARFDVTVDRMRKAQATRAMADAAQKNLEEALLHSEHHPKSWRWKAKLADWLITSKQSTKKVYILRILNEARLTCPVSVRVEIDGLRQRASALR